MAYTSIVYYPGWVQSGGLSPSAGIDYSAWTHIVHFGFNPNTTGQIVTSDMQTTANCAPAIAAAHAAGKQIIMCIGEVNQGANFVASTGASFINTFVANIVANMQLYGYDGVDIDWEESVTQAPFVSLLQKLRAALDAIHAGIWLSADVDTGQHPPALVAAAASSLTMVNDMTYWDSGISEQNAYIAAGIPAAKLTLGLGFSASYNDLTQAAVGTKVSAAAANGYAGTMAWQIGDLSTAKTDPRLTPLRAAVSPPSPFYMSNVAFIHNMYQVDSATTAEYFGSPYSPAGGGAFGISNNASSTGIQDGMGCTPMLKYISYGQFWADVTGANKTVGGILYTPVAGGISPAFNWLMYDPEVWSTNPPSPYTTAVSQTEMDNPWLYMANFATLAHAHGYQLLCAPARDLGNDATSVKPKLTGESLDAWYMRTGIATSGATADIFHVQNQADTTSVTAYDLLYNTAAGQAAAVTPGIPVSAAVSAAYGTAAQMETAASTVQSAAGFWVNLNSSGDAALMVSWLVLQPPAGLSAQRSSADSGGVSPATGESGQPRATGSTAYANSGRFAPVRIDGGGTIQVMDKGGPSGVLIAGADTQGYYRSSDNGDHWQVCNSGVGGAGVSDSWRQCASIKWSITEGNTVYAAVGEAGAGGGLLVSADGGGSWSLRSAVPQFAGNHQAAPLPSGGTPRSTGNLLAQAGIYLFAGTWNQGILRSADHGATWPLAATMAGQAPGSNFYVRSLAADPGNTSVLYAACYDQDGTGTYGRVWKCSNALGGLGFTQLAASPASPEELCVVAGVLYAACGTAGLWRSPDGGTTWQSLNGTFVGTSGSIWAGIAGYARPDGTAVITASDSNPQDAAKGLIRLAVPQSWPGSGAIAYTALTGAGAVQTSAMPPDGRSWWMHDYASTASQLPGALGWQNGYVLADPDIQGDVYACGGTSAWRMLGASSPAEGFTVAVNGAPCFPGRTVACDPLDAGHLVACSTDWNVIDITGGLAYDASAVTLNPPVPSRQGYAAAFDPADGTVYASCGNKGAAPFWGTNTGGTAWYRAGNTYTWTDTGLAAALSGAGLAGHVALGLCALRDGTNQKILLAAVWGGGIWRGVAGGAGNPYTWTQAASTFCNTVPAPAGGNKVNLAHAPGTGNAYAYCYDPDKGIYQSADFGVTWALLAAVTSTDPYAVSVSVNPAGAGTVWLTASSGAYKITNPKTAPVLSAAMALPASGSVPALAGCVAVSSDAITIYLTTQDSPGSAGTRLLASTDGGVTWSDAVGDGSLALCCSRASHMDIAADGRIYLSGSNIVAAGYPFTGSAIQQKSAADTASLTEATTARSLSQNALASAADGGESVQQIAPTHTGADTGSGADSWLRTALASADTRPAAQESAAAAPAGLVYFVRDYDGSRVPPLSVSGQISAPPDRGTFADAGHVATAAITDGDTMHWQDGF